MSDLPAGASRGIATIARHTMARMHDATELLGVDVQPLAGRFALVANDGRRGSSAFRLDSPRHASRRLTVDTLRPTMEAMRRMGMRERRNCSMRLFHAFRHQEVGHPDRATHEQHDDF
ncbi:hypothetical protein J2W36_005139 [Variovorax ginsengisoli]|uniref:Tyr recombinase domain-containing protein n=1 Tax=Variovorax ginsengisoli TaxID=363844 RepID=A0ABT9SES2_9BURK|nr:hypothetical protein [Variovorax ginsengisoli]